MNSIRWMHWWNRKSALSSCSLNQVRVVGEGTPKCGSSFLTRSLLEVRCRIRKSSVCARFGSAGFPSGRIWSRKPRIVFRDDLTLNRMSCFCGVRSFRCQGVKGFQLGLFENRYGHVLHLGPREGPSFYPAMEPADLWNGRICSSGSKMVDLHRVLNLFSSALGAFLFSSHFQIRAASTAGTSHH